MTSIKTKHRRFVGAIFAAFNKCRFRRILAAIFAAFSISLVSTPATAQFFDNVWHVDEHAAPDGNGLSWTTPFDNLQDALDEAEASENESDLIKVAQGLYIPTVRTIPANARSVTFLIDFNEVTIQGGYAGINEMNPDIRNVNLYVTTLSGAIDDPFEAVCGPDNGDCFDLMGNGTPGCEDEACCTTVCAIDPVCCLLPWDEGCALIALSTCDGSEVPYGAYHVVTAKDVDDTVRIRGLTITLGSAGGSGANSRGGGVFIDDASPAVIRCVIIGNGAGAAVGDGAGGGMHITGTSNVTIVNCTFRDNFAREGGGLHLELGVSSATLVNCLFHDNDAIDHGGAIDIGSDESAVLDVINCTFVNNTAGVEEGGAFHIEEPECPADDGPTVLITNCILWNNTPDQIEIIGGELTVRYSNVEGTWPGTGNLDVDPMFVDAPNGDYRIQIGSMVIDKGDTNENVIPDDVFDINNDGDFVEPTPDLDLFHRVLDGDQIGGDRVDMGAYEFVHPDSCPWDLDGGGFVGAGDLLILLANWGNPYGALELLALLADWGPCPCCSFVPLSLAEELADACLSQADWDDFVDVMADPNAPQVKKDRYLCWMEHYLFDCNKCTCSGLSGCPNPDPFN